MQEEKVVPQQKVTYRNVTGKEFRLDLNKGCSEMF